MKDFQLKLIQGKYEDAANLCFKMRRSKIKKTIMEIAYDTESISVYSFVQYMITKEQENIFWIELAIDILINPLCFIEGAYSVALFYARELLSYEKNIKNLEMILFFYNIPEKLIEKKEAEIIVNEIIKIDPDNQVVLETNIE